MFNFINKKKIDFKPGAATISNIKYLYKMKPKKIRKCEKNFLKK
jgi:hypothetical protein